MKREACALCLVALALVRCGGDDDTTTVRFLNGMVFGDQTNFAPTAIDVFIDDALEQGGVPYSELTDRMSVKAGKHKLGARLAGAADGGGTLEVDVREGEQAVVIIQNNPSDSEGAEPFLVTKLDSTFAQAEGDTARVRFTIASIEVPLLGGSFAFGLSIDVGRDGADGFLFALEGTDDIAVSATAQPEISMVAVPYLELSAFIAPELEAGKNYYGVAIGSPIIITPEQKQRMLFIPADGRGEVRIGERQPALYVLNAMTDVPSIQLRLGGEVVSNALEFGDIAGPFRARTGALSTSVFPGISLPVLDFATLSGVDDQIAIVGSRLGAIPPMVQVIKPAPSDFSGIESRFRAVNASTVANIDVALVGNGGVETPLASNLAFGTAVEPPGVAASVTGDLVARRTGEMNALDTLEFDTEQFPPQYARAFVHGYVVAIGSDQPNAQRRFELKLVVPNALFLQGL